MTWLILSALAVFVAWHWEKDIYRIEYEKANTIYERYYTWKICVMPSYYNDYIYKVWKNIVYECWADTEKRQDDFYIVFDIKNQTWERYRKTQLLRLYIMSNENRTNQNHTSGR